MRLFVTAPEAFVAQLVGPWTAWGGSGHQNNHSTPHNACAAPGVYPSNGWGETSYLPSGSGRCDRWSLLSEVVLKICARVSRTPKGTVRTPTVVSGHEYCLQTAHLESRHYSRFAPVFLGRTTISPASTPPCAGGTLMLGSPVS